MKYHTLLPLLLLSSFAFVQNAMLSYKFRTHEAKAYYNRQNGDSCVQKAEPVKLCGRDYLKTDPVNVPGYKACVEKINFPPEFEREVLALKPENFLSDSVFYVSYNDKLLNYVKTIDGKCEGPANKSFLKFSMNFAALFLVLAAFAVVYFINRKPEPVESETSSNYDV